MEVDEYQKQVSKFQRVSSNGSTTSTDNSLNPQKIATDRPNLALQSLGGGEGGGGVARLCGWPSSRIVRVSRASGGKDRHSKVLTSKGLRDRRVRLSVSTAIQFYDLQDRLGYDQPSKAVEWLLKAASSSIDELPSLDPPFPGVMGDYQMVSESNHELNTNNNNTNNGNNGNIVTRVKSPGCSSTSETSKGSGLSLSRSENRMRARERAREMASKKEKDKDIDPTRVTVFSPENPSFTDLLTGGINTSSRSPMDYFFNRSTQPSPQLIQIPQLQQPQHNYSFLQDTFMPAVATTTGVGGSGGGGGEIHNFNFGMTSSPTGGGGVNHPGGFSRGTLQSNLPSSSILPHHQHLQRFQSGSIDGSASTNLPFFIVPNSTVDHYPGTGGYQLNYGGGDGGAGRRGDYHKDKSKN